MLIFSNWQITRLQTILSTSSNEWLCKAGGKFNKVKFKAINKKGRKRPKKIKLMPAKGLNDGEGFKQKGGVKGKRKAKKQRPK